MCGHEKLTSVKFILCKFILCYRRRFEDLEQEGCYKATVSMWCGPSMSHNSMCFFWFGISVNEQSIEHWTQQFCTTATYHITSKRSLLALGVTFCYFLFGKELLWLKTNSGDWCVLMCQAGNQSDTVLSYACLVWCADGRVPFFPCYKSMCHKNNFETVIKAVKPHGVALRKDCDKTDIDLYETSWGLASVCNIILQCQGAKKVWMKVINRGSESSWKDWWTALKQGRLLENLIMRGASEVKVSVDKRITSDQRLWMWVSLNKATSIWGVFSETQWHSVSLLVPQRAARIPGLCLSNTGFGGLHLSGCPFKS